MLIFGCLTRLLMILPCWIMIGFFSFNDGFNVSGNFQNTPIVCNDSNNTSIVVDTSVEKIK